MASKFESRAPAWYQWQKYCSLSYVSNLFYLKTERGKTKKHHKLVEQISIEFISCPFVVSLVVPKL